MMNKEALVADVGGTNIRLAIADLNDFSLHNVKTYQCADFENIDFAIEQYKQDTGAEFNFACIDVACPVNDDIIKLTNNHWRFSVKELEAKLQLEKLIVINDFTAIAMSVPHISDDKKVQIGGALSQVNKPIAIYGAGTGLGVAHLVHSGDKWIPLGGEGGHVDFAAITEDEKYVLNALQQKYARVSAEQVLSGQGLKQIYQALCQKNDVMTKFQEPAEITEAALTQTDSIAEQTLQLFCRVMGSFGGNLALNMATFGGVYIAGGIVPRFVEYFKNSDFRARFEAKGRFESFVREIPVYVVTEEQPGLLGCAAYIKQEIN